VTRSTAEIVALIGVTIVTAWTLYTVPSWQGVLLDPCLHACIGATITVALLWLTRSLGSRAVMAEQIVLTIFLVSMPFVYLARYRYAAQPDAAGTGLWIELLGVPIYAALAVLGWKRSPWFLAVGIAAHGLGWDAWHYGNSAYIPAWYALGCLLLDLAIGAYVAVRIPAYTEARRMAEVRLQAKTGC
jgi:hypothetical protein